MCTASKQKQKNSLDLEGSILGPVGNGWNSEWDRSDPEENSLNPKGNSLHPKGNSLDREENSLGSRVPDRNWTLDDPPDTSRTLK